MNIIVRDSDEVVVYRLFETLPTISGCTTYNNTFLLDTSRFLTCDGVDLTEVSEPADQADRCTAHVYAKFALADVDWSTVALTRGERLIIMGEMDLMTDSDWSALKTKYN